MPIGMRSWLIPTRQDVELPKAAMLERDGMTSLESVDLHALSAFKIG